MGDTVYEEYKLSVHYSNRTGVRRDLLRLSCAEGLDAQVRAQGPGEPGALRQVRHGIDLDPEKFEAQRMELAQHVWATMKGNDSHECRNCHSWEAMNPAKQGSRGRKKMGAGQKEGKTCIECQKGVAHLLPKEYKEEDE